MPRRVPPCEWSGASWRLAVAALVLCALLSGAGAGVAGVAWAGAAGLAAWLCVALLDCCPTDLPPPKRLEASACKLVNAKVLARIKVQNFMGMLRQKDRENTVNNALQHAMPLTRR